VTNAYNISNQFSQSNQNDRELYERIGKAMESDEGRKSKAFKDTRGYDTIGVGHKIKEDEQHLLTADLTDKQINEMKQEDLETAVDQVRWMTKNHRNSFNFDSLPINQKEALVNLVFNMGVGEVSTWNNTLDYLEAGEYKEAGKEILRGRTKDKASKYAQQLPNRSKRVSKLMGKTS